MRFWGRAPENAQMGETVVLTSTGKGAACSKVFATRFGPIREPVDDVPQVPYQPPASSVHTPGNKVAQFTVVSSPPLSPLARALLCFLVVCIVWPVDLSMFHSNSYDPGPLPRYRYIVCAPGIWANWQLTRMPHGGMRQS